MMTMVVTAIMMMTVMTMAYDGHNGDNADDDDSNNDDDNDNDSGFGFNFVRNYWIMFSLRYGCLLRLELMIANHGLALLFYCFNP